MDIAALRERQKQLLRDLGNSLGQNHEGLGSGELAAFVALVGRKYPESRESMIVGIATNGWGWRGWSPGD